MECSPTGFGACKKNELKGRKPPPLRRIMIFIILRSCFYNIACQDFWISLHPLSKRCYVHVRVSIDKCPRTRA